MREIECFLHAIIKKKGDMLRFKLKVEEDDFKNRFIFSAINDRPKKGGQHGSRHQKFYQQD